MSDASTYASTRLASFGALGGLVGAVVMGLLALMMPIPNTGGAPFFVAAAMMMGAGSMAVVGGWALHLITGVVVGAIFGVVVAKVAVLHPRTRARSAGLGLAAGIAVWLVFFMPIMVMLMPALASMPMLIGGSFVAHAIFGLVLGGVTSAGAKRVESFKCEVCSATLGSRGELEQHARAHMSAPAAPTPLQTPEQQAVKCEACGAAFHSRGGLAQHAKQAHPMPAQ